jgi:hypothetical protein
MFRWLLELWPGISVENFHHWKGPDCEQQTSKAAVKRHCVITAIKAAIRCMRGGSSVLSLNAI